MRQHFKDTLPALLPDSTPNLPSSIRSPSFQAPDHNAPNLQRERPLPPQPKQNSLLLRTNVSSYSRSTSSPSIPYVSVDPYRPTTPSRSRSTMIQGARQDYAQLMPLTAAYRPRERIAMVPLLSKSDWAHNMLVRPHNAIRRTAEQAHHMVDIFFFDPRKATQYHVHEFFSWWNHVASLISTDFDATVSVVFHRLGTGTIKRRRTNHRDQSANKQPPTGSVGTIDNMLPVELSKKRIRFIAALLEDMVDGLNDIAKRVWDRSPADTMARCMKEFEAFKPLLAYYDDMERKLPIFLTRVFSAHDGHRMEQDYWKTIAKKGRYRQLHQCMILHSMPKQDSEWVKRNILTMTTRLSFNSHIAQFKQAHLAPARLVLMELGSVSDDNIRRQSFAGKDHHLKNKAIHQLTGGVGTQRPMNFPSFA